MASRVDQIYRSILHSKFFTHGWGKPENLRSIFAFRKILSNRASCMKLVDPNHPITITKEVDNGDHVIIEAQFKSPLVQHLPNLLPKECETAYFQMLIPKQWSTTLKPTCLHLAGTGDHRFWRRRILMAKPLLQEAGIASIIHENPFYGLRKPQEQVRSCLRNVSDLFLMGSCLVLESLAILHWVEKQGFGPVGLTGISMGGHMASLAACSWNKPIPLVPCLSWSTASGVFTQGVLSGAINWERLKSQYFSDKVFRDELFNMIQSPEGHFRVYHEVGLEFARDFPKSLKHFEMLRNETDKNGDSELAVMHPITLPHTLHTDNLRTIRNRFKILEILNRSRKNNTIENLRVEQSGCVMGIRPEAAKDTPAVEFEPYVPVKDPLTWEALQFMRGIMDECTHLGNFNMPVDPSLIIIVAAENDAYMPMDGVMPLTAIWPGSELRTLKRGHIAAFLFNQQVFRQAVVDSFKKTIQKYYGRPSSFAFVNGENAHSYGDHFQQMSALGHSL